MAEPQELKIKIAGVEYPFPSFDTMTFKEAREIKAETGVVMGQFFNALEQGDPDALIAISMLALRRSGKQFESDDLDSMKLTDIEIIVPEPKEELDPASPLPSSEPESEPSTTDSPVSADAELFAS